ncbi:MAG: hypothetical protein R2824_25715 [Saprospiraceae bacterium]|nr:hypothetical protein [Lewinella sp.]
MYKGIFFTLLLSLGFSVASMAQHIEAPPYEGTDEKSHLPFRVAGLIGHTLIPTKHAGENLFIPSWGLDLEYWIHPNWGIGLHNDIEIETFVILYNYGEERNPERVAPLVLTLDALIKPFGGLVVQFGPGIEFEKKENFALFRAGLEYEIEIGNHWDISPTIFYDTRFEEYHTWSFALGIGRRF